MQDLCKHGIESLAAAYRVGETDPVAVVAAYRDRIATLDPQLNSYATLNPDLDRDAEESANRLKSGDARSPLEGVPIAAKDNLVVRGIEATWGSAVFAGKRCEADELPMARLRAAGAIFLGKTNTPEFAVEGYTHNRLFGTTGNTWNPELTPGGSSGGTVSAVAAGIAAAGVGTDGGGSIRRPAGYSGLYGLKPTIGEIPRAGGLPQVLLDFEVVGSFARSTADLRLLHSAMTGPDLADPVSRKRCVGPERRDGLRILYVPVLGDNPCDFGILDCCEAAAERLRSLGHKVETGEMPFNLDALNAFWPKFGQVGLARMRAILPKMAKASAPYLAMADQGDAVTAPEFYEALEQVRNLRAAASAFFDGYDLIMTPSSAAQPWAADQPFPPQINDRDVGPRGHAVYTGWVNAAGLPALNLPAPHHPDGMPVGFQLVGDLFAEEQLLHVAQAYEATGPGWRFPDWVGLN
jgi:Asp-tRNA(Asn)/Glu-tRNA(Gln) amidotransferase A subunit family amidase